MRNNIAHLFALSAVTALLLLAGCGSDTDEDSAETETTSESDAADTTETDTTETDDSEVETTEGDETETETTESDSSEADTGGGEDADETDAGGADGATGSPVSVSLDEWVVDTESTLEAGAITFEVANVGSFPHEFGIARGESYDTLPQLDNGAIDEDTLGDDLLGKLDRVSPGESGTIEFDLEAGNYVFFCNIAVGPNSHAANGQVLSVTVE